MDGPEIISIIKGKVKDFNPVTFLQAYPDEIRIQVILSDFKSASLALHQALASAVMMFFCVDERKDRGVFVLNAVFVSFKSSRWITVSADVPQDAPSFESLAKDMQSAALFEREIREMFGLEPKGNPDLRRLNLHDEVWPQGNFPLRKDYSGMNTGNLNDYRFGRVDGVGIFEVPVGPVHAGIIGPGHFRFSAAGEPIINLEIRLGFTHRGIEKLFENRLFNDAVSLSECISGDSSFAHSIAFTRAAEKISGVIIPKEGEYLRGIFLELERMYNHVNDIAGIAVDVGFSFPAAYGSIIKESILQLNDKLTASRYLKKVNTIGGILIDIDTAKSKALINSLEGIKRDFTELVKILSSSVSFMDRVDTTGVLKKKTALDLGVVGLAARASGIPVDLRKYFPGIYQEAKFKISIQESGDVLARLKVRISEFEESCRLIEEFCARLRPAQITKVDVQAKAGSALGYAEGWRGPVLYWLKTDANGLIQRCKIVDPSFHNWQGLSYAVLGNIIPDFPLINKSFDLSYPGNDL